MKKFCFLFFVCAVLTTKGFAGIFSGNMEHENICVVDNNEKEEDVKATAIAYAENLYKAAEKRDIAKFKKIHDDSEKWFSTLDVEMREIADDQIEAWYEQNPEAAESIVYMIETYIEE